MNVESLFSPLRILSINIVLLFVKLIKSSQFFFCLKLIFHETNEVVGAIVELKMGVTLVIGVVVIK